MAFKHYTAGDEVGGVAIKNNYDRYATAVLHDRLELIDRPRSAPTKVLGSLKTIRGRRPPAKYRVKKDLPPPAEYQQLKNQKYETTVESLVGDGYGEVESLGEEMREWYDGMGENLQCSGNGEAVGEAADALENASDAPELPTVLGEIKLVFLPDLKITSRNDRCCEAASCLRQASDAIGEYIAAEDVKGDDATDYQEITDQLANHADELEAVDFPGMYG